MNTSKLKLPKSMILLVGLLTQEKSEAYVLSPTNSVNTPTAAPDTNKIGTLEVPNVGIGTISWSSDDRKFRAWYISLPSSALF
jgi:hypothetical protein